MEEVATMKLNYTILRPSLLPAAACAPSISYAKETVLATILAAEWAPASRGHQVQIQAELVEVLGGTVGSAGTTGFNEGTASVGSNVATDLAEKQMKDGASGVPPRGRPV
jgi:hypothetical protein